MTKKMKHFKRWLALLLAVVLVGGICIFSNSGSLWATEGVAPATEEAAETADTAEPTETVSETVEIILSDEDSDTTEPTEAQPEEGTKAVVPEGGSVESGVTTEGEKETPKAEALSEIEEKAEAETEGAEKEETVKSVKITSNLDNTDPVEEGTELTLTAHLTGFDDVDYKIQWQQSEDGTNWDDVDGENDMEYTVVLTEDNEGYLWRVLISTLDA